MVDPQDIALVFGLSENWAAYVWRNGLRSPHDWRGGLAFRIVYQALVLHDDQAASAKRTNEIVHYVRSLYQ